MATLEEARGAFRRGLTDKAMAMAIELRAGAPRDADILALVSELHRVAGDHAAAVQVADMALDVAPTHSAALVSRIEAALHTEDETAAKSFARRLANLPPPLSKTAALLVSRVLKGQVPRTDAMMAAAKGQGRGVAARIRSGRDALAAGDTVSARSAAESVLAEDPAALEALLLSAHVARIEKNSAELCDAAEAVAARDAKSALQFVEAMSRLGEPVRAGELLARIAEKTKDAPKFEDVRQTALRHLRRKLDLVSRDSADDGTIAGKLRLILTLDPDDKLARRRLESLSRSLNRAARESLRKGDLPDAATGFSRLLATFPDNAEAARQLAMVREKQEDWASAATSWAKTAVLSGEKALMQRAARAAEKAEDLAAAVRYHDMVVGAAEPAEKEAAEKRLVAAVRRFSAAVLTALENSDPQTLTDDVLLLTNRDDTRAQRARGRWLAAMSDRFRAAVAGKTLDPALAVGGAILQVDPGNEFVRRKLSEGLVAARRFLEASHHLKELTRLEPESVRHWATLGRCLAASGQFAEASASYANALALDSNNAAVQKAFTAVQARLETKAK